MTKFTGAIRPLTALVVLGFLATSAFANGPIRGVPGWTLIDDLPASCWAERTTDVRVRVLVSKTGHPVLTVSRSDWRTGDNLLGVGLQIDRGATVQVRASGLISMVLVGVSPTMESKLLKASTLTWHLPWGTFITNVSGIGKAFAAAAECQRTKPH